MPLIINTDTPAATAEWLEKTATPIKPAFLIVYASLTNGRSWCGDCSRAESYVEKKFGGGEEEVRVVYAGQPGEWRIPSNPWRQAPFSVTNLPTLIKVDGEGKWEKLVEGDVYNQAKLDNFLGR